MTPDNVIIGRLNEIIQKVKEGKNDHVLPMMWDLQSLLLCKEDHTYKE